MLTSELDTTERRLRARIEDLEARRDRIKAMQKSEVRDRLVLSLSQDLAAYRRELDAWLRRLLT